VEATRELYRIKSLGLVVEASKGAVLSLQLGASSLEVDGGVEVDRGVEGIGFVDVDRIAYS